MEPHHTDISDELKKLEHITNTLGGKVVHVRDSAFKRFPFAFIFLTSFGLVATLYGFEKVIDQIPYFIENPHMVLVSGIVTLIVTGTLYKKLS